jgi:hypothetical protein
MSTMTSTDVRHARDREDGNMVIAMAVIMILAMLSAAVIARTIAGQKSARQGQDFSGALANADAGLSDALFRMDQLGIAAAATFCVGPNAACTVASIPGAPKVQYTARRVDDNTYTVFAKGVVNGQQHAIRATVTRSYQFPYAIFAKTSLSFNGNTGNYDSGSCSGPVETVDATDTPSCFPSPDVASNGAVTCNGSNSPAKQQDYYEGGSVAGCTNAYLQSGTYNPLNPALTCPAAPNIPTTPCLPSSHSPCPAVNGVLPLTLLPGNYLCTQLDLPTKTLSFQPGFAVGGGAVNNGQVAIFVIPTDGSNIKVSIADTCGWQNPNGPCSTGINYNGDPTKLAVYLAGGTVDPGNGMTHSGNFNGIMWAPNAAEANPSCNASWRGGLVVNTFTCNGGTHLDVRYDTRMMSLVQTSWSVTNYTEIPSNQVTLP